MGVLDYVSGFQISRLQVVELLVKVYDNLPKIRG